MKNLTEVRSMSEAKRVLALTENARQSVEDFWAELAEGWSIEPREFFEAEYLKAGFNSAVAMAMHHLWKRAVSQ